MVWLVTWGTCRIFTFGFGRLQVNQPSQTSTASSICGPSAVAAENPTWEWGKLAATETWDEIIVLWRYSSKNRHMTAIKPLTCWSQSSRKKNTCCMPSARRHGASSGRTRMHLKILMLISINRGLYNHSFIMFHHGSITIVPYCFCNCFRRKARSDPPFASPCPPCDQPAPPKTYPIGDWKWILMKQFWSTLSMRFCFKYGLLTHIFTYCILTRQWCLNHVKTSSPFCVSVWMISAWASSSNRRRKLSSWEKRDQCLKQHVNLWNTHPNITKIYWNTGLKPPILTYLNVSYPVTCLKHPWFSNVSSWGPSFMDLQVSADFASAKLLSLHKLKLGKHWFNGDSMATEFTQVAEFQIIL